MYCDSVNESSSVGPRPLFRRLCMERMGLVESQVGEPTAIRGGRAKTYFTVNAEGIRQLRASQRILKMLLERTPQA
jgi:hypothetical protein